MIQPGRTSSCQIRPHNDSHAWERAPMFLQTTSTPAPMPPSGCIFSNLSSLSHFPLGLVYSPHLPQGHQQNKGKGLDRDWRPHRPWPPQHCLSLSLPTQLILAQPRPSFTRASSCAQNITFLSNSPPAESSLTVSSQRESLPSTTRSLSFALFSMLSTASISTTSSTETSSTLFLPSPFTHSSDPTSSTAPRTPTVTLSSLTLVKGLGRVTASKK